MKNTGKITQFQLALSPSAWTPVICPAACNFYFVKNMGPDAVALHTDDADPTTEDTLGTGGWEGMSGGPHASGARFAVGEVLYLAKGTGPLLVKVW